MDTNIGYAIPYVNALKRWGNAEKAFNEFKERYDATPIPDDLPCYSGEKASMYTFFMVYGHVARQFIRLSDKWEKALNDASVAAERYYGYPVDTDIIKRDYNALDKDV